MFTGIIECTGLIKKIISAGSNLTFWIHSPLSEELKIDQSLAHNGVCLTVEKIHNSTHRITAIEETLRKTNLRFLQIDSKINLERCLLLNGRLDGHIVQGHVDATATCISKKQFEGSWEFSFMYDKQFASLVIEKGSIAINGISLTCFNVFENNFTVAIIPYTFNHTNCNHIIVGSIVNIEFDIIGKYIQRKILLQK